MHSIFDCIGSKDLDHYLRLVSWYRPSFDTERGREISLAYIRFCKNQKKEPNPEAELELKWYKSLEIKQPDYSVYDDDLFLCNLWACWIVYSRQYLLALRNPKSVGNGISIVDKIAPHVRSVADLGCGFGYTTAGLKELFPNAVVFGTNLPDMTQTLIAEKIGSERGFQLFPKIEAIKQNIDLVFASEYFEHIEFPVDHLLDIISCCEPRYFIFANSFGAKATGHFNEYGYDNYSVANKSIGKVFNKALRWKGYKAIKTKLWNNRPSFWVRMQ